ncbi:MAG: flagellar biosynthetic protein FliR [Leptonema sp. (in: bacteria)]
MEPFFKGFWMYLLILARISGLVFFLPILSSENIPYRIRMSLVFFISMIFFPLVSEYLPKVSFENFYSYLLEIFVQFFIGAIIGFFIQVIFSAFVMTGELFGIQMGVSFSEVLDPQSEVSLPLLGTLKNLISMILFLVVDFEMDGFYIPAYLHIFRALQYSFVQVPTMDYDFQTISGIINYVDQSFGIMFLVALKIGLPLVGILFITSLTMGIIGKASPQLNILNLGLQINILTGFMILLILYPVIIPLIKDSFIQILDFIGEMFYAWPKK